ncbi:hypothetical protein CFAM422_001682 [Trichoderma lentiforme]|uniref:Uncharacterized protein n=1 Tax=Trichoderma lentiforme TaxID=1567552 RepID=A0A9P4XPD3_9HYPO|nr:hypothetical protein CFAM422_001682 [Trichoderma lentiforme]
MHLCLTGCPRKVHSLKSGLEVSKNLRRYTTEYGADNFGPMVATSTGYFTSQSTIKLTRSHRQAAEYATNISTVISQGASIVQVIRALTWLQPEPVYTTHDDNQSSWFTRTAILNSAYIKYHQPLQDTRRSKAIFVCFKRTKCPRKVSKAYDAIDDERYATANFTKNLTTNTISSNRIGKNTTMSESKVKLSQAFMGLGRQFKEVLQAARLAPSGARSAYVDTSTGGGAPVESSQPNALAVVGTPARRNQQV